MDNHHHSASNGHVDLDKELRRLKQPKANGSKEEMPLDDDLAMDNWLFSSQEAARQRDASLPQGWFEFDKEEWERFEERCHLDRAKWKARRRLDPGQGHCYGGKWVYDNGTNTKRYHLLHHASSVGDVRPSSGSLITGNPVSPVFSAHEGEDQISSIYHQLCLTGDRVTFLNAIYTTFSTPYQIPDDADPALINYAVGGIIPEETIWRIFRCLVSELVPTQLRWPGIPDHILAESSNIWQVGKHMLLILTNGRFWDEGENCLGPVDNGDKFGYFKRHVLQKLYSKNLIKYALGCLAIKEEERYTRKGILEHSKLALSVFEGTFKPEIKPPFRDGPYQGKNPLIPEGLNEEEGAIYETLINVVQARQREGPASFDAKTPHIAVITDLAKDYDDLLAMLCLKEFHRLGLVKLKGFVANLSPARTRALFGRGVLDYMKLPHIPVGVGMVGETEEDLDTLPHEFDHAEPFMAKEDTPLPGGQQLLKEMFQQAIDNEHKLTLLLISSFMDISKFSLENPDLLRSAVAHTHMQGGYSIIDGELVPDPKAANNKFDMVSANQWHSFLSINSMRSTVWTKVVALATPIYQSLFIALQSTGHPIGDYLRKTQVKQDVGFYEKACSPHPFAPHMDQDWFVSKRSTWFEAGNECDDPYPEGEDMIPYFTKVVAYDALAALGVSGEDVLDALKVMKPLVERTDQESDIHRVVGPLAVEEDRDRGIRALGEEVNIDTDKMGLVISALLKGAILASVQDMEAEPWKVSS